MEDVRRFEGATISSQHDAIVGASTTALWREVEEAAQAGVEPRSSSASPAVGKGRMARGYAQLRNRPEAVFNPTIQAVPLERDRRPDTSRR